MKQVPIIMPQMGQSVAEGTILRWHKKVGEAIAADEVLLEVETDKTTVDVESPASGTVAACFKREGELAAAGETIGLLEAEGADEAFLSAPGVPASTSGAPRPAGAVPPSAPVSAPLPEIDRDYYSPYILRMALLNNVPLSELQTLRGTGRHGRITRTDLLRHLAQRPIASLSVPALAGKAEVSEDDLAHLGKLVPMTSLRRTIADHMVQSIHTSAHVTMVHAVDVTHVVALRNQMKDEFARRFQAKMTYTAVILFATSRVLREFPKINASIYGSSIVLRKDINIGCAVALADETLVVPVVRNADRKSFPEVAQDLSRLIGLARNKALRREDVDAGTFTLSNFGSFGSLLGTPIINQPQVAILGMGAVFKAPVVVNNEITVRDQLYLSFSFDHRIIDGELGGRFLNAIQKTTESLTEESLNLEALG